MWANKLKLGRIAHCAAACIPSRRAAFAATVALFAALGAQATTYWLGTGANASDSNDGTSKDAPFATWEYAFTKAGSANANVLNVLPGTYTVTAAPATWATSRNDVTIQGVDADGNPLASAQAASAVVVDGAGLGTIVPVRASIRTTISGITFRNGKGAATTGAAIHMQGTGTGDIKEQGFAVSNCVFETCTGGPAVYSEARGVNDFEGCVFSRNANSVGNATAIHFGGSYAGSMTAKGCRFVGNDGSGASSDGKGVAVYSIFPVDFSDCTFDSNTNTARGVALYLSRAGASNRFERCTFRNNVNDATVGATGLTGSGGVAYVGAVSTNVFVGCTFEGNSAAAGGGCVSLRYGRFVAEDCTFTGNTTTYGSAITYAYKDSGSSALFSRCTISENTAPDGAVVEVNSGCQLVLSRCDILGNTYTKAESSAVLIRSADSLVDSCAFRANTTGPLAGGASVGTKYTTAIRVAAGTVRNCLVVCNTNLISKGAAIYSSGGTVLNCTVVGNRTASEHAGIYPSTSKSVRNCILADNVNPNDASKNQVMNYSSFEYCFADANVSASNWDSQTGNVRNAGGPGFVDAANGDYTLLKGSVCRNAGDNGAWSDIADAKDLAGKARINEDVVDIGCYEFFMSNSGMTIFVR